MKTARILLVSLALFLISAGLTISYLHKTITIQVDGSSITDAVWALRVGPALQAAGVEIRQGDQVSPPLQSWLAEDANITVRRAMQVQILADDQLTGLLSTSRVPRDLLAQAQVELDSSDRLLVNGLSADPDLALPERASYSLQVQRSTEIELLSAGSSQRFRTLSSSLGAALATRGLVLQAADQLEPAFDTVLDPASQVPLIASLERARPITIETSTGRLESLVQAETAGEALAQAGMALQGLDYSLPAADQPLPADGRIRIVRVHTEILLETEALPFGVEYVALPEVELDTQQVVQTGAYGIQVQRVEVRYEDGVEVARQVAEEWIAQEPQPRLVGYGTKIVIRTEVAADGTTIEYWRKVDVFATRYSPCNLGIPNYCNYTTASGKTLQKGMIGVIRSWFNMMRGSGVYVPNYGYATIEDIGAGFADRHWIDLAYSDEEWTNTANWTTLYFLTPVPANIMWILE